jgi:RND family efflux transporter MFP subunit
LPALAALAPACGGGDPAAGGPPAFPPAVVQVAVAEPTAIEDASEYIATLKSLHSTAIQPQVEGQVVRIHVKSGDRVAAGAPLVQIDARREQAAVSSQEAERASREADVTFARSRAERARELFKVGAISKQELEEAETALQTAAAQLKAIEANVRERQVQLRYYTVTAPTAGVVGDVPVRVGNQVTPDTHLTSIARNDTLELHVSVPVERAAELRTGLPLRILGDDGRPLAETTVTFVAPSVDDRTQSVLAKGIVANPGGRFRSDQFVRARLVWKTTQGLVIPVVAVTRINGQPFAYVAEPKDGGFVARQRGLRLGAVVGDNYAVVSGIAPGDRVVTSGIQKLADGAPVTIS